MPLIRIQHYPNFRQVFVASEEISHLAVVEISTVGVDYVQLGSDNVSGRIAGIAWGSQSGAVSGKAMHVVTQGIVSGVVCASSINAGDRVTAVSGGRINAYNVITPAGAISGYVPINLASGGISGNVGWNLNALVLSGQYASGLGGAQFSSGAFAGTALITARVLGKALASGGGAGSGIPVLVTLGG